MNETGIIVAIVLGILNAFVLGMKMRKDSKNSKNNNPRNLPCSKNTVRIAVIENEVKNIKEDIKEIKNKLREA